MTRRIMRYAPKSTLIKICNAVVISHCDYCSMVWDNCADYLLEKLQKLQNRAARVITSKSYEVKSEDRRRSERTELAAFKTTTQNR